MGPLRRFRGSGQVWKPLDHLIQRDVVVSDTHPVALWIALAMAVLLQSLEWNAGIVRQTGSALLTSQLGIAGDEGSLGLHAAATDPSNPSLSDHLYHLAASQCSSCGLEVAKA
jgi:hypothetical protein